MSFVKNFSWFVFGLFVVGGFFFSIEPVQAEGPHCWCQYQQGSCEHHTTYNDDGKTDFTCGAGKGSCNEFCDNYNKNGVKGWHTINCDYKWIDRTLPTDPNCAKPVHGQCTLPDNVGGSDVIKGAVIGLTCDDDQYCEGMRVQACTQKNLPNDPLCQQSVKGTCKKPDAPASSTTSKPSATANNKTTPPALYNPLGKGTTIQSLIARLIKSVLGIVGALALLAMVWGGLVWMTAGGEPKRVENGKTIIINATIGLLIIFFSYTLTNVFLQVISGAANNAQQTTTTKTKK